MNSAAITDHGVMYGVIDFYREAKKNGIKPILAVRFMLRQIPVSTERLQVVRTGIIILFFWQRIIQDIQI